MQKRHTVSKLEGVMGAEEAEGPAEGAKDAEVSYWSGNGTSCESKDVLELKPK